MFNLAINDNKRHQGFFSLSDWSSHLFFADDALFFCSTELMEAWIIQNILKQYELALSQKINNEKTNLFFGKPVSLMSKMPLKIY